MSVEVLAQFLYNGKRIRIKITMTTKQRLIKRINKAFGFELTDETPCFHHQGRRWGSGGFSWVFAYQGIDIGCSESMTECLKWKRWVFSKSLCEIFEYHENDTIDKLTDLVEDV